MHHAEKMAILAGQVEHEVEEYLANLRALFDLHDETLGIVVDD